MGQAAFLKFRDSNNVSNVFKILSHPTDHVHKSRMKDSGDHNGNVKRFLAWLQHFTDFWLVWVCSDSHEEGRLSIFSSEGERVRYLLRGPFSRA